MSLKNINIHCTEFDTTFTEDGKKQSINDRNYSYLLDVKCKISVLTNLFINLSRNDVKTITGIIHKVTNVACSELPYN